MLYNWRENNRIELKTRDKNVLCEENEREKEKSQSAQRAWQEQNGPSAAVFFGCVSAEDALCNSVSSACKNANPPLGWSLMFYRAQLYRSIARNSNDVLTFSTESHAPLVCGCVKNSASLPELCCLLKISLLMAWLTEPRAPVLQINYDWTSRRSVPIAGSVRKKAEEKQRNRQTSEEARVRQWTYVQ